jgi:serine/threonine protein kinase
MPILTPEERLGQSVAGRYRLDTVLSTGGMGVLFEAIDVRTGVSVAVKMLKPAYTLEKDRVARFLRETRIAAELEHPNIASVLEVWQDETGVPFLIMELLRGCTLDEELDARGTLPLSEALDVVVPIARALSASHASGIIHRDVKPANIFLCREGSSTVVPKLLDFGIAKTPGDDFETQTGLVLGTPGYMAPEQAQHGECGPFTDIWAVGAVLYRALMGHPPHGGNSVGDMLSKLVREPVPPLAAKGVPRAICATIDRALALDPHRRYSDMNAFVRTLTRAAGLEGGAAAAATLETEELPLEAEPAPTASIPSRPRRSLGLLYVALGALALGALLLAESRTTTAERRAASAERPPVAKPSPRATDTPNVTIPVAHTESATPRTPTDPGPMPVLEQTRGHAQAASKHGSSSPREAADHPLPAFRPESSATFPPSDGARAPRRVEREPNTGIPVATEW